MRSIATALQRPRECGQLLAGEAVRRERLVLATHELDEIRQRVDTRLEEQPGARMGAIELREVAQAQDGQLVADLIDALDGRSISAPYRKVSFEIEAPGSSA